MSHPTRTMQTLLGSAFVACLTTTTSSQIATWHPVTAAPAPLLATWQSGAEKLVLVGPATNQRLWEWDGQALRERLGALQNQPTILHLLTDPSTQELVALGSGGPAMLLVGRLRNGQWSWQTSLNGPSKSWNVAATFDAQRRRLVVVRTDQAATSVHEWDGQQWWLAGTGGGPANRTGGAFAYDPNQQRCVLYGGTDQGPLADCWAWDGFAWQLLAASAAPGPRRDAATGFDPALGSLLLHGGANDATTWQLIGTTWQVLPTSLDAPAQSKHHLLGSSQGAVLVPAGIAAAGFEFRPLEGIRRLQGGAWQTIAHFPEVTPRNNHNAAFDPIRGHFVVFGGTATSTFPMLDQTLLFDGWWQVPNPSSQPPRRFGAPIAWSPNQQRIVLFGGDAYGTRLADTWSWTGSTWHAETPAIAPPARSRHVLVEDRTGGLLLFGGADGNTVFGDQWRWDGTAWTQLAPPTLPGARAAALAAYDPDTQQVVLWGGQNPPTIHNDTWLWDGSQWTATGASSPDGNLRAMAFEPNLRSVLAIGNTNHVWTGTQWQPQAGTNTAGANGQWSRVAVDTLRNRMFWFHPPEVRVLSTQIATATAFGQGCAVVGEPGLGALGTPTPARTMVLEVASTTPHTLSFLILGLGTNPSSTTSCTLLVAQELTVRWTIADASGTARHPLSIPNVTALRGLQLTSQGAVYDPPRSPIGSVTLTRGLRLTVGD